MSHYTDIKDMLLPADSFVQKFSNISYDMLCKEINFPILATFPFTLRFYWSKDNKYNIMKPVAFLDYPTLKGFID